MHRPVPVQPPPTQEEAGWRIEENRTCENFEGAPMRGTMIGARGEPRGRVDEALRGRSAQAQVQVRGYKEEKLELAARTLCFICPSFASCALVRRLSTQCSPLVLLSLYLLISLFPSPLAKNLAAFVGDRTKSSCAINLFRSIVFNPATLSQFSSTRPGRCCIFIIIVFVGCYRIPVRVCMSRSYYIRRISVNLCELFE